MSGAGNLSLVERLRNFASEGKRQIPPHWKRAAVRLGFDAGELHAAFVNGDKARQEKILAGIEKQKPGGVDPEILALVEADFEKNPPRKTWGQKVKALALAGVREIPADLKAEGERFGVVSARELHSAIVNDDKPRLVRLVDQLSRLDNAVSERIIAEMDAAFLQDVAGDYVEVLGLLAEADEEWRREHPGREPGPGEVFRWENARQLAIDAERDEWQAREDAAAAREKAMEAARMNRDMLPPVPSRAEIEATFAGWYRKNWDDRLQWPTVDELRMSLALPSSLILRVAKVGRWGARNVWRGGPSGVKRGRPPWRVSPAGLAQVLRSFGARNPCFAEKAAALAGHLKKG